MIRFSFLTAVLFFALAAVAQTYPAKPIHLIVPFTPGGTTDIMARTLGQKWTEAWGKQVIIDNRPGAGGTVGVEAAAKSAPDGYTVLVGHIGTLAVNPALYPKLPYDPLKSFTPVMQISIVPSVLVVHPAVRATTVAELVALARANPGKLNYSSAGGGSAAHLSMEYFKLQTGTEIVHVPYKGTAPSLTDLVGGQVSMTMTGAPAVMPHVQAGRLRALGVSSIWRVDALPDIPTIAESGFAQFDATQWYGILVPAGTPRDIIMKLNAETRRIMQSKEVQQRLRNEGAIAASGTPEEFAAHIKSEIARWGEVVRKAGMKAD
jgi:tripartite-type tricarboxylate transporter receptor subunit TctC